MRSIAFTLLLAAGCAQVTPRNDPWDVDLEEAPPPYHLQGMLGVMDLREVDVGIDGASEGDPPTLPLLGGALQYPMAGGARHGSGVRARLGLEAGATFGYDGETDIFFIDNGTAVVRSDDRLFVADLFGGPYADLLFGDAWRAYGGLGPLIQYGSIDIEYDDGLGGVTELDDDGFGLGWHVRTGLELRLTHDTFIGIGVRYVDTEIDFGGGIGEFQYEALQAFLTVTSGF